MAAYSGGGLCVRCARRKATRTVRAPNGSKDAVCRACAVSSGLGAGGYYKKNPARAVKLKNFSGTIKRNPDGTVTISGVRR